MPIFFSFLASKHIFKYTVPFRSFLCLALVLLSTTVFHDHLRKILNCHASHCVCQLSTWCWQLAPTCRQQPVAESLYTSEHWTAWETAGLWGHIWIFGQELFLAFSVPIFGYLSPTLVAICAWIFLWATSSQNNNRELFINYKNIVFSLSLSSTVYYNLN